MKSKIWVSSWSTLQVSIHRGIDESIFLKWYRNAKNSVQICNFARKPKQFSKTSVPVAIAQKLFENYLIVPVFSLVIKTFVKFRDWSPKTTLDNFFSRSWICKFLGKKSTFKKPTLELLGRKSSAFYGKLPLLQKALKKLFINSKYTEYSNQKIVVSKP